MGKRKRGRTCKQYLLTKEQLCSLSSQDAATPPDLLFNLLLVLYSEWSASTLGIHPSRGGEHRLTGASLGNLAWEAWQERHPSLRVCKNHPIHGPTLTIHDGQMKKRFSQVQLFPTLLPFPSFLFIHSHPFSNYPLPNFL